MTILRQGDVFIIKVDKTPQGEVKKFSEKVLAYGEVTGHKHLLKSKDAKEIISNAGIFVDLQNGGTVVHEEHAPLVLPKGIYEIRTQREFDPMKFQRMVQD